MTAALADYDPRAAKAEQMPPGLMADLHDLGARLDRLTTVLDRLGDRLGPVLADGMAAEHEKALRAGIADARSDTAAPTSPARSVVAEIAVALARLTATSRDLVDRIQL